MKKRIIALLMSALFVLNAAACSGSDKDDKKRDRDRDRDREETEAEETEEETEATETTVAETEAPPETEARETESEETEATEGASSDAEFRGYFTDDGLSYVNDYFGFELTAPEGWTFATAEDMQTLGMATDEMLGEDGDDLVALIEQGQSIIDAYLYDETGMNVNVSYASSAELNGGSASDALPLIEASMEPALDTIYDSYDISITTCTCNGVDYDCIQLEGSLYGFSLYQYQIYMDNGPFLAIISFTTTNEADVQTVLDTFST